MNSLVKWLRTYWTDKIYTLSMLMNWNPFEPHSYKHIILRLRLECFHQFYEICLLPLSCASSTLFFQYHREFYRILPKQDRHSFAWQTVCWAKNWLHFLLEFVNPGDGTVPLWATQSFQFLVLAACPELTVSLTGAEFLVRLSYSEYFFHR